MPSKELELSLIINKKVNRQALPLGQGTETEWAICKEINIASHKLALQECRLGFDGVRSHHNRHRRTFWAESL